MRSPPGAGRRLGGAPRGGPCDNAFKAEAQALAKAAWSAAYAARTANAQEGDEAPPLDPAADAAAASSMTATAARRRADAESFERLLRLIEAEIESG